MIDLTPLLRFIDPANHQSAISMPKGQKPDRLIAGRLGAMCFVVTVDGDGTCEASLSTKSGRPTRGQQAAFWRHWGIVPDHPEPLSIMNGRGLHWCVRRGIKQ